MSRYACALCAEREEAAEPDERTGLCSACWRATAEDEAEGGTLRRRAARASPLTVLGVAVGAQEPAPCSRCWKREPAAPGGLCDLCAGVPAAPSRADLVRLCTPRALVSAALSGLPEAGEEQGDPAAAARAVLEQNVCDAWHEEPELMRRAALEDALAKRLARATAELAWWADALGIDLDAALGGLAEAGEERGDPAAAARAALEQNGCDAWHEEPELMRRAALEDAAGRSWARAAPGAPPALPRLHFRTSAELGLVLKHPVFGTTGEVATLTIGQGAQGSFIVQHTACPCELCAGKVTP